MKVKLLVGLSGPTFTLNPGDIYECDDSEATRLICARYAVETTASTQVKEVAVPAPVETATIKPVAEKRRKKV